MSACQLEAPLSEWRFGAVGGMSSYTLLLYRYTLASPIFTSLFRYLPYLPGSESMFTR